MTNDVISSDSLTSKDAKEKKPRRIIRRRKPEESPVDPILLEKVLQESNLPKAYSFEIPKTVQRINSLLAAHIALQMPEGLLIYATVLGDIFRRLCPTLTHVSVLADVTYGACCVDDLGAQALGAELLVHYGHSCLVPLQHTVVPCLYVFVEIQFAVEHMVECLHLTLQKQEHAASNAISLLGTIQFRHAFGLAKELLENKGYSVHIPQAKPLSPGEVLGCTSPVLSNEQTIVCFVADGRFHLESALISNPHATFYRYDPYSQTLTIETYQHEQMKTIRSAAIFKARAALQKDQSTTFGIILGTLGRQGNPAIVQRLKEALHRHGQRHFVLLLSEITPAKLQLFRDTVSVWVQVACPRLSVDWGHYLSEKPVLSPYELFVCLDEETWRENYPMDYYSQAGGPWSNYHESNRNRNIN